MALGKLDVIRPNANAGIHGSDLHGRVIAAKAKILAAQLCSRPAGGSHGTTPDDPPALRGFREFWSGGWRHPASTPERIDFAASFRQVREIHSLRELPVRIISAGTVINSAFMPENVRPALQSSWDQLQSHFLRLSPHARQSFAMQSGHFVQRDAPEVVIEAITDLIIIERLRARGSLQISADRKQPSTGGPGHY
jgi:pimeloyl-ACP methyl ester carboxylesterase